MGYLFFNEDFGYLEGLVRGLKSFMLTKRDYNNLIQSETLEDVKLNLMNGNYATALSSLSSPITVSMLEERLKWLLVREFFYIRSNSVEPLSTFLDFITHGYMIDNISLLISGVVHHRPISELLPCCHPLGGFERMKAIKIAETPKQLYSVILSDTPLADYFKSCVSEEQFDEMRVEIIRSTVYKSYIESFYELCKSIGGSTFEVMKPILQFEADRRAFSITMNSLGTELNKEERIKFFPTCGKLGHEGLADLAKVDDFEQIKVIASHYAEYAPLFSDSNSQYAGKTIEDRFFEHEVKININSFFSQFNFGIFYSYLRLMEQQTRNIIWIAECIAQKNKKKIEEYIKIF